MLIDGEKFACEACVRGHRVSNCQHSDRPLQHINKKGRPVSQCQHCRSMRKSRAAHVKCDCGEKTSKCAHLQPALEGHRETCCCNHGGRCTCSHKKESGLDTVPEGDPAKGLDQEVPAPRPRPPVRRRRANTVHSDGAMAFDQNGNRIVPKHNRIASKCGPYQLSRVNSMHSAGSLGSHSPDGLPDGKEPLGRARAISTHHQRRVKSEAASPLLNGASGLHHLNGQLPPLDLSGIEYPPYVPNSTFDMFGGSAFSEHDGPIFSAGLSTAASVDWSHIELSDKGDNFAPSSYGQACSQSFSGMYDWGTGSEQAPTLGGTTSTSGEVSEVEDNFISGDLEFEPFGQGDYLRSGQLYQTPGTADLSSIGYDNFVKDSTKQFGLATSSSYDDAGPVAGASYNFENDPVFWGQQFNDGIATYSGANNNESTDGVALGAETWTSSAQ
ncbi:hypothetical protein D7B24_001185 [Verticillium nonalfalfae]|uniref:Copper-fist domain-containing protein n=1 Tax=Verticillium nonalfalfae TaxID=1051616 RepID=A0A3M9Y113_9PEZI|nr:uncharacterized protein D7B24_001185 [Verticillium nonalfalfae]RNJ53941.1 hypothetical protein D7B24_001185 [Verticillium nonalfalfae]